MIVYSQCPLCASSNIEKVMPVKDHSISKEEFEIMNCKECEFTFTNRVPEESEAGKYYQSEDYISHSDTSKGLVNKLYHFVRDYMLGRKKSMIASRIKGKKLLDIGSGTGYFLNYMKSNDYEVQGVEVSEEAKEIAVSKFGLKVNSPNEFLQKNDKKFNVITLWHVLEHLYDLDKYMKAFDQALEQGGLLYIAVPNCASYDASHYKDYWAAYDVPRHLWHFTPETMKFLANKSGFEVLKMKKLPFDAFYNCLLSEKYKSNGLALFAGFFHGLISYLKSVFNVTKSSSVVYILKKSS